MRLNPIKMLFCFFGPSIMRLIKDSEGTKLTTLFTRKKYFRLQNSVQNSVHNDSSNDKARPDPKKSFEFILNFLDLYLNILLEVEYETGAFLRV